MKKVIFPETQEDLQKHQDQLRELLVPFEIVSQDGKIGLEFDQDEYHAASERRKIVVHYKKKKPTFFERYKQIPMWGRAVIGVFLVAILINLFSAALSTPEAETVADAPTELLFDAKAAFNASPDWFEQNFGKPVYMEEKPASYACGDAPCIAAAYQQGKMEVRFRDNKAVYIAIDKELNEINDALIANLGYAVSVPNEVHFDQYLNKNTSATWTFENAFIKISTIGYFVKDLRFIAK